MTSHYLNLWWSSLLMNICDTQPQWVKVVKKFNPLAPGRLERNFREVIFKLFSVIGGWGIFCEIVLIWRPLDLTEDKLTLVQVMAWCYQATSHYLSQCWPRSLLPYGVTRPQWVNVDLSTKGSVAFAWEQFPRKYSWYQICKMSLNITFFKLLPHLPGANELSLSRFRGCLSMQVPLYNSNKYDATNSSYLLILGDDPQHIFSCVSVSPWFLHSVPVPRQPWPPGVVVTYRQKHRCLITVLSL